VELASLMLTNLPPAVNKAHLYRLVAALGGQKQVFFSFLTNSALVVLDSREDALQVRRSAAALHEQLGPDVRVKLVAAAATQVGTVTAGGGGEEEEEEGGGGSTGLISKPESCRDLVRCLVAAGAPVVVDCHHYKNVR
jgi:hypothetical protein